MGRLTLNALLSFAQFEREVTAERIRDKFRASKEKGMWMGGRPPLGYDIKDRSLIINKEEAKQVNHIFGRYLVLGSVLKLAQELKRQQIHSKCWITQAGKRSGGNPFTRGALYSLLQNPIYIGKIRHKELITGGSTMVSSNKRFGMMFRQSYRTIVLNGQILPMPDQPAC